MQRFFMIEEDERHEHVKLAQAHGLGGSTEAHTARKDSKRNVPHCYACLFTHIFEDTLEVGYFLRLETPHVLGPDIEVVLGLLLLHKITHEVFDFFAYPKHVFGHELSAFAGDAVSQPGLASKSIASFVSACLRVVA